MSCLALLVNESVSLEKAILDSPESLLAEEGKVQSVHEAERMLIRHLSERGRVARVHDVAKDLSW